MTDPTKELAVPSGSQGLPTILIDIGRTFTRSDGTIVARIYERLTKASRRRVAPPAIAGGFDWDNAFKEKAYRRGVYDAYKNLQEELNHLI